MGFHFFIKASFIVDTRGWYCVTKCIEYFFFFLIVLFQEGGLPFCEFYFWKQVFFQTCVGSPCLSGAFRNLKYSPQKLLQRSLFVGFSRFVLQIWQIHFNTSGWLPWLPETFLEQFPVSVKSLWWPARKVFLATSLLVASAYGRRCVGLRPTPKIPAAREKNLWYPGYWVTRDGENVSTVRIPFVFTARIAFFVKCCVFVYNRV